MRSPRLRGGLRTDSFMLGSFSDNSRIVPALEITFHLFANIFSEILQRHFACEAQYLVRLDHGTCCSAHCK